MFSTALPTFEELIGILISVNWPRLVNAYPETSFKSLSSSTSVLHYSLRQYSQYTVIGRTALVTSQIQGKSLAAAEIKRDKQDNKLPALINTNSL